MPLARSPIGEQRHTHTNKLAASTENSARAVTFNKSMQSRPSVSNNNAKTTAPLTVAICTSTTTNTTTTTFASESTATVTTCSRITTMSTASISSPTTTIKQVSELTPNKTIENTNITPTNNTKITANLRSSKSPQLARVNVTNTIPTQSALSTQATALCPKRNRSSPEKATTSANATKKLKNKDYRNETKQQTLNHYWLGQTSTANRFELLSSDEESEDNKIENTSTNNKPNASEYSGPQINKKQIKPPPIYVQGVQVINTLITALNSTAKNMYELKVLQNNEIKIQSLDSNTYRLVVKMLNEKNTKYYTYKPKQSRGFRVILRNMHYSTDQELIKQELSELGHVVTNISNIRQARTKKPLSLFSIELLNKENNKSIYEIKCLLHCKISFEPPHPKREIPQCANCQSYGHTKNYCTKAPVCVICAGDHKTLNCTEPKNSDNLKCALCENKHTANYKGCEIYKKLKIQRFPALRKKELATPVQKVSIAPPNITNKINPETTFAQAISKNLTPITEKPSTPSEPTKDIDELKEMMKQLMAQMANMMNIITMLLSNMNNNGHNK